MFDLSRLHHFQITVFFSVGIFFNWKVKIYVFFLASRFPFQVRTGGGVVNCVNFVRTINWFIVTNGIEIPMNIASAETPRLGRFHELLLNFLHRWFQYDLVWKFCVDCQPNPKTFQVPKIHITRLRILRQNIQMKIRHVTSIPKSLKSKFFHQSVWIVWTLLCGKTSLYNFIISFQRTFPSIPTALAPNNAQNFSSYNINSL